jgi:hypothetical protein
MSRRQTPEGGLLRAVMELLAAEHVFSLRMNTGAMFGSHNGKRWAVKFGLPGCADILAFPHVWRSDDKNMLVILPLWLELKAPKGVQSELQKSFQAQVEAEGHRYVVVRDVAEVLAILKGKGK